MDRLKELLGTMNYGSVTLIVQDGKVIQLEKNEKIRMK
ncbi:YezD family protein [Metabacillus sp. SLBN-84]